MRVEEIAAKVGVETDTVRKYVKDGLEEYRAHVTSGVERLVAAEWAKLEVQERAIWDLIRGVKDVMGAKVAEVKAGLFGRLAALNKQRMDLINKIDPGEDQSFDTAVSFVIVRDRRELPRIIEAKDFAQRVISNDMASPADTQSES